MRSPELGLFSCRSPMGKSRKPTIKDAQALAKTIDFGQTAPLELLQSLGMTMMSDTLSANSRQPNNQATSDIRSLADLGSSVGSDD